MNKKLLVAAALLIFAVVVTGSLVMLYVNRSGSQTESYLATTATGSSTIKNVSVPVSVSSNSVPVHKEVSTVTQKGKVVAENPTLTIVSRGVVTISPGQVVEIRQGTTSSVVASFLIKKIQSSSVYLEATGYGERARSATSTGVIGGKMLLLYTRSSGKCVEPSGISMNLQAIQGNTVRASVLYIPTIGFVDCG